MSVIYYDLETTDRFTTSQIVGLGAIDDKGNEFHRYIIPTCNINFVASKIHGIKKIGDKLFCNGQEIEDAIGPNEALKEFVEWLEERKCRYLVAHNNFKFDKHVLQHNLNLFGLVALPDLKHEDSMEFVKKEFPELKSKTLKKCLDYFCGKTQSEPHDALDDAKAVKDICKEAAKRLGYNSFKAFLEQ